MKKIGVIYSGNEAHYRTFHEPKINQFITKLIYHPEFLTTAIDDLDVLIVPSQLNGELLMQGAQKFVISRITVVQSWRSVHNLGNGFRDKNGKNAKRTSGGG